MKAEYCECGAGIRIQPDSYGTYDDVALDAWRMRHVLHDKISPKQAQRIRDTAKREAKECAR